MRRSLSGHPSYAITTPSEEDGPDASNSSAHHPATNQPEIPPHPAPFEEGRDIRHMRRASERFDREKTGSLPLFDLFTSCRSGCIGQITSCSQSDSSEPEKWKHATKNDQDDNNDNIHSPRLGRRRLTRSPALGIEFTLLLNSATSTTQAGSHIPPTLQRAESKMLRHHSTATREGVHSQKSRPRHGASAPCRPKVRSL